MKNRHSENSLAIKTANHRLKGEVKARKTRLGKYHMQDLPSVLKQTASIGAPAEFKFNRWGIRYLNRDELGMFLPHWMVYDALTGIHKKLYNKDYINPKTGNIQWKRLAKDMTSV